MRDETMTGQDDSSTPHDQTSGLQKRSGVVVSATDSAAPTQDFMKSLLLESQRRVKEASAQVSDPMTEDEIAALSSDETMHVEAAGSGGADSDASEPVSGFPGFLSSRLPMVTENRYRDLGQLGAGGMGVVRRVHDSLLNRILAMKILHPQLLENQGSVMRFVQEAQVGAQLQHPNILPVYDLGLLDDGSVYFTMAEIIGHSFTEQIRRVHDEVEDGQWNDAPGQWNLHRLMSVFHDLCNAISYAHGQGVVHRDLKPDNIMIGPFGEVLVVDWGLAKIIGSTDSEYSVVTTRSELGAFDTVVGTVTGTPAYMAPEQALGRGADADERSDIYALGAILYEVLRGIPPYGGKSAMDVLGRVVAGDFVRLSSTGSGVSVGEGVDVGPPVAVSEGGAPVPKMLVDICERAMEREAEDRFASVAEMVDLLGGWLDGSKRRESALHLVAQADFFEEEIGEANIRATTLRKEASELLAGVDSWRDDERKRRAWQLQDEATALTTAALIRRTEQTQLLRSSLAHKDDLSEAHERLAKRYLAIHQEAESQGDFVESERAGVILREHIKALPSLSQVRRDGLRYLDGGGLLSLQTKPEGASVTLRRLQLEDRRLAAGKGTELGATPLVDQRIERGTYVAEVALSGFHKAVVPIFNGRLDVVNNRDPDGRIVPIALLPEGVLGADDCYVPAGWCWLGGDAGTPNSLPRARVWVDGFVMGRFPVTHEQYVLFLNGLVEQGEREEAELHVPREQSSSDDELGAMAYLQDAGGRFRLPDDPARAICWPRQPVTMIQWRSARAYAAWLARRTGKPWRLPMEFEWEKAARGVDGRHYPWGNAFDPSWSCMKDSHEGDVRMQHVDSFPLDESIYGVRGTAGNTRDWCLDRFREDGPPLENGRLLMPTQEDLSDMGFKSTRGGSYGNSASRARSADRDWWFPERSYVGRGLRLVWGLADTEWA